MANTLKENQSNVICGLGTFTRTISNTNMYKVKARATENPTSSLSISITQSGSASATITSDAPAADQNNITVSKVFNCVAGDVITIVISSAAATDNQLNTVKTTVAISEGSYA
jgi:hypothetical protein